MLKSLSKPEFRWFAAKFLDNNGLLQKKTKNVAKKCYKKKVTKKGRLHAALD